MRAAARQGETIQHASSVGTVTTGSPNILINGRPAARKDIDQAACEHHSSESLITGCATVLFNGHHAARLGDHVECLP